MDQIFQIFLLSKWYYHWNQSQSLLALCIRVLFMTMLHSKINILCMVVTFRCWIDLPQITVECRYTQQPNKVISNKVELPDISRINFPERNLNTDLQLGQYFQVREITVTSNHLFIYYLHLPQCLDPSYRYQQYECHYFAVHVTNS